MKKISDIFKRDWPFILIIILGFAVGIYFYPSMPSRVPIHWNSSGHADNYGPKLWGVFGLPLVNLGIYALMYLLPYIDPRRQNYERFDSTYRFLRYVLCIFFLGFQVINMMNIIGSAVNTGMLIMIVVSLLFILIGNVMGKFKHNYFVGIKTPWTLASEEVWNKTHRMAAPIWVIGGILNLLFVILGLGNYRFLFMILIAILVVVPIVYSYIAYAKVSGGK